MGLEKLARGKFSDIAVRDLAAGSNYTLTKTAGNSLCLTSISAALATR